MPAGPDTVKMERSYTELTISPPPFVVRTIARRKMHLPRCA